MLWLKHYFKTLFCSYVINRLITKELLVDMLSSVRDGRWLTALLQGKKTQQFCTSEMLPFLIMLPQKPRGFRRTKYLSLKTIE